jgi:hypothetical protein
MGWLGLIILIVIISFIAVTVMGWDNYIELVQEIWVEFGEFVSGGVDEARERI